MSLLFMLAYENRDQGDPHAAQESRVDAGVLWRVKGTVIVGQIMTDEGSWRRALADALLGENPGLFFLLLQLVEAVLDNGLVIFANLFLKFFR